MYAIAAKAGLTPWCLSTEARNRSSSSLSHLRGCDLHTTKRRAEQKETYVVNTAGQGDTGAIFRSKEDLAGRGAESRVLPVSRAPAIAVKKCRSDQDTSKGGGVPREVMR